MSKFEVLRAGSSNKREIPPSGNKNRNPLIFSILKTSTCPHEQGEHIAEEIFGVRVVVREIWTFFVLLAEALLYRG